MARESLTHWSREDPGDGLGLLAGGPACGRTHAAGITELRSEFLAGARRHPGGPAAPGRVSGRSPGAGLLGAPGYSPWALVQADTGLSRLPGLGFWQDSRICSETCFHCNIPLGSQDVWEVIYRFFLPLLQTLPTLTKEPDRS